MAGLANVNTRMAIRRNNPNGTFFGEGGAQYRAPMEVPQPTPQLATTSQDILSGKGATQGLVLPQATPSASIADQVKTWANGAFGTTFGGPESIPGMEGQHGAYTAADGTEVASNIPANDSGWATTAGGVASGLGAAAGLANAYMAYKNYGLAKDKFAFEKAATNRSIANQASEYNTGIQNAGEVGMALAGGTMDANARAARQAQLDGQKISGLAIG